MNEDDAHTLKLLVTMGIISLVISLLVVTIAFELRQTNDSDNSFRAGINSNYQGIYDLAKDFNGFDEKLKENDWVYIVDENTGQIMNDPNTGFPLRFSRTQKIAELIQANNSQQEQIDAHDQALAEIVNWINSIQG